MSKEQFVTESGEPSSGRGRERGTGTRTGSQHEDDTGRSAVATRAEDGGSERDNGSDSDADANDDADASRTDTAESGTRETDAGTRTISLGIGLGIELEVDPDADEVFEVETTGRSQGMPRSNSRFESAERASLAAADIEPEAVANKEYSYQMLLETEIDEDLADCLRRRFSLPWSFQTDDDHNLDRRSNEVRGLGAAERAWIAASGDEAWQTFEGMAPDADDDGATGIGGDRTDAERDGGNRPWPRPTPVTTVTGVGPNDAETLAEAGIRSAERLATINAATVARLLELDVLHVRTWRHNAREVIN
ncbi:helix-hairpin-helix domain-containing protein [Natrialba asiatica]|uniref:Helix-hairpin-helix domain-containing protein n=1 Tax=Natrialba asiatica (strain ATCC 700177 / DSM 12278 / JCM 9576 / FERM P-10747 / NBRC 102637 / 172P1) TaxID=29540 RepID=M0ANY8_NATA1|nr:helix-hairpin-helix domain-containing protein [Natrialba asiatica]ELZ00017.1 hypothetical protein C481_13514 [Natrialba asiatica DSM 12278]